MRHRILYGTRIRFRHGNQIDNADDTQSMTLSWFYITRSHIASSYMDSCARNWARKEFEMEYTMFEIGLILFGVVSVAVIAIDAWDDYKRENMK